MDFLISLIYAFCIIPSLRFIAYTGSLGESTARYMVSTASLPRNISGKHMVYHEMEPKKRTHPFQLEAALSANKTAHVEAWKVRDTTILQ